MRILNGSDRPSAAAGGRQLCGYSPDTLIQHLGSAVNLNIHLHCLVLDGVYRRTDGEPVFVEVPAPNYETLRAVLHKIC